jgi:DNA-directed RNA polymerase subunit N (RpoN/RPB10)
MLQWMLQWLYAYVVSVCFKCFSCFKRMLQVFYLDVAYVTVHIHMLQAYVVNVLSVSNICCRKWFYVVSVS